MTKCPVCDQSIPDDARFCGVCGHRTVAVAAHQTLVGATIAGRYQVLRVVAEGGMGIVYEAQQLMGEGSRRVAIKTLLPELSRDPIVVSRFNRECGVVASLEHPNTVRVYDFGTTEDGTLYIAMEFVQGRSLGDVIAEGPVPLKRCLNIAEQICSALQEAHDQGIVHRDLKPDNLVLSDRSGMQDFVKVLDFGIAKRSSTGGKHETKLTQQGMVLGTPPYMSPEQFAGTTLDRASDIYSLAIICYEMLNAKLPFEGDTPWQWAHLHMSVAPAAFSVAVPEPVQRVVYQALSKPASARPPSTMEFYRQLAAAAVGAHGGRSRASDPVSTIGATTQSDAPRPVERTEPTVVPLAGLPNPRTARGDSNIAAASTAAFISPVTPLERGSQVGSTLPPPNAHPAVGSTISPVAAPHHPMHLPTGTEPSVLRLVPNGPGAPAPLTQPRRGRALLWAVTLGVAAVLAAGVVVGLWANSQRTDPGAVAESTIAQPGEIATEIAGESSPVIPSFNPPAVVTHAPSPHGRGVATTSTAHSTTSATPLPGTAPPPGATATAATQSPFPLPFPIALPSVLMPPGLPPVVVATPTPTATPAPPSPLPQSPVPPATAAPAPTPAPNNPAPPATGLQLCERAAALANTDLDAAVAQYQSCEASVGRAAAGATKARIAMAGVARAAALAAQGRCNEAEQVAQTLSRIGAYRPAHNAAVKAGCP